MLISPTGRILPAAAASHVRSFDSLREARLLTDTRLLLASDQLSDTAIRVMLRKPELIAGPDNSSDSKPSGKVFS